MPNNKNNTSSFIVFIIITIGFALLTFNILKPTKTEIVDNQINSAEQAQAQIPELEDVCDKAKELLFRYEIKNPSIEKIDTKKDYGDYIKIKTLKDYFFVKGELNSPGGYSWELAKISDNECQVKIILYDNETEDKINPVWNVRGTEMTWFNIGAFDLTPELDYSE